jgi:hypothetical protein
VTQAAHPEQVSVERSSAVRPLHTRAAGFVASAAPFVLFVLIILLISYEVLPFKGGVLIYSDGAYLWPSGGFDFISTWNASNSRENL